MSLLSTLSFIVNHPLNSERRLASIKRFVTWQIGSRLVPGAVAVPFVNETRLLTRPGMTGATGNLYCGLHEFEDMAFVLHFLREEDLFVDVGANIGSYTVLAAGAVGARTISIEPIEATFSSLLDNVRINGLDDRVRAMNLGVGGESGTLRFTQASDTTNHVVSSADSEGDTIDVRIESLDSVLAGESPRLIKVDVEGFETEVIGGAEQTFSNPALIAALMELNGSGDRYGFDEDKLHQMVLEYGFESYSYVPLERRLVSLNGKKNLSGNTLYIRDVGTVAKRLREAPKYSVLETKI
ncbi:FkbM family methyltransferase [Methylocaldum sp. BRCS4]|jgi:FkbM family methyltransferase|nr:FkbM family methyltransferase [Methylocaldum sp. RMAD-M]MVF23764.1 FkbM family methyltransferase [Methylocaldum sp. BRCS4]